MCSNESRAFDSPLNKGVQEFYWRPNEVVAMKLVDQILTWLGAGRKPFASLVLFLQQSDDLARVVLRVVGETLALGVPQFCEEFRRDWLIHGSLSFHFGLGFQISACL